MMKFFLLLLPALAVSSPPIDLDIPSIAIDTCKRVKASTRATRLEVARKMYEVEKEFNVPPYFRGMTLAAACSESGFNPNALGDKSRRGRYRAVGVLQLWPWWEKRYSVDRRDPVQSTRAWLNHIFKQIPKVKKRCKSRNANRVFVQAWVHAIRAPKAGGRCKERPLHLRHLKRIRKAIKKELNKQQQNDKR